MGLDVEGVGKITDSEGAELPGVGESVPNVAL